MVSAALRSRPPGRLETCARVCADAVRVAGLASLGWAVAAGEWVDAALFSLVLLGLVLPRIAGTRPLVDLVDGLVVLFAAWAAVLDLYIAYPWLDVVVHALACGLVATLACRMLAAWEVLPAPGATAPRRAGVGLVLVTAAVGTALGVLWEIGEWYGHTFLDHRIQVGYGDTLGDLASDGVGALGAGLVLLLGVRHRHGLRDGVHDGEPPEPLGAGPGSASSADTLSVSVVVPVKDDAVALERCLARLRQQTVAPLEVVVVDNGSSDMSARVARRFGARVVPEPAPGIPAAAATGYDAARADLIARCDADSIPPADWLERIVRVMATHPRIDAVTGSGRFYDLPRWAAPVVGPVYLGSYYLLVHAAMGRTPVWGSNMALRRTTWEEIRQRVHRDDPELHDDIDLAFALAPHHRVRYDGRLVVGVSGRSVRGLDQLARRVRRAVNTLRVNWRLSPPWLRWQARFASRRA
jgi:hypothetical protein